MCAILGTGGSGFFLQVNILRIDLLEADMKDLLVLEYVDCRTSGEVSGRKRRCVPAVEGKAGLNGREVWGVYSRSASSLIP
jgi:hypothetical protein